jgi:signal transduction histidine kinase
MPRRFRIYNEALNNIARHAKRPAAIALTIAPREILLVVADNGVGLGKVASTLARTALLPSGHALKLTGVLRKIAGAANAGTTLTVSLPIP